MGITPDTIANASDCILVKKSHIEITQVGEEGGGGWGVGWLAQTLTQKMKWSCSKLTPQCFLLLQILSKVLNSWDRFLDQSGCCQTDPNDWDK